MISSAPSYHGYRFPPDVIAHAVWLYFRFRLSFRDVEDLLAQLHGSVCEQPRRSLAPTHPPTGAPDAAVQVGRAPTNASPRCTASPPGPHQCQSNVHSVNDEASLTNTRLPEIVGCAHVAVSATV